MHVAELHSDRQCSDLARCNVGLAQVTNYSSNLIN